jgi:flagellar capping protein FliD
MAGMSLGTGLISGLDTASLISQLMQVEANPQTLLKQQLSATKADAAAYRALNTRFEGLRAAAEALGKAETWTSTKAASSATSVSASAGAAALPGSLTFSVTQLAAAHSVISDQTWPASDASYGAGTIAIAIGGTSTDVPIGGSGSLAEAVKAINASGLGVTATAVKVSASEYRLQVSAATTGATTFTVGAPDTFDVVTTGKNAELTVGTEGTYTVTSSSNTFDGLLPDTTITVSEKTAGPVTVRLSSDPDAVANKVSSLVTAANGLLEAIESYTSASSATAVLKGDSAMRGLVNQVLNTVSTAVGGSSASQAGLQLTRDGAFTFDKEVFTAKLKSEPALVQKLFLGTPAGMGPDGKTGGGDDVAAVQGIAARLGDLAASASNSTTGTLTLLATSRDKAAADMQDKVDAWDVRLAMRKQTLSAQFTAMETALGTLQNQSSWLSSQITSLPQWSTSSSS